MSAIQLQPAVLTHRDGIRNIPQDYQNVARVLPLVEDADPGSAERRGWVNRMIDHGTSYW